jgi:hypothetical protein
MSGTGKLPQKSTSILVGNSPVGTEYGVSNHLLSGLNPCLRHPGANAGPTVSTASFSLSRQRPSLPVFYALCVYAANAACFFLLRCLRCVCAACGLVSFRIAQIGRLCTYKLADYFSRIAIEQSTSQRVFAFNIT